MPPVEVTGHLALPTSLAPVKVMDKAMELPLVNDAVSEVSKYAHNISENDRVKHARQLVEDCLQGISDNERLATVKDTVLPITSSVKESLLPHLNTVKESVMPRVAGAVETLDNMACDGLDHLKTAVPSLTYPTSELVETVRETTSGYFSMLAEYLASFSLAQLSLRMTDRGLVLVESAALRVLPESKGCAYVRSLRRSVRAARRAGARRNLMNQDELTRSGILGQIASTLHLNAVLGLVGLELVPAVAAAHHKTDERPQSRDEAAKKQSEDLPEARVEDLQADLSEYRSEEDPDFEAGDDNEERGSSSSSSSDSEEDEGKDSGSEEEEEEKMEEDNEKAKRAVEVSSAEELQEDSFVGE